jgi:hypothetical protein
MIKLIITTKGIDKVVSTMLKLQKTEVRRRAISVGANAAIEVVKDYYRDGASAMWSGTGPTQGAGRKKTQWWRGVANNWNVTKANSQGATLTNANTVGFSHKITGGTIKAMRKKFLTIPVDPRAHGLSAKGFSNTFKSLGPLFRVKNILAVSDGEGKIKPIFVLKQSVTQRPWANALVPEKNYVDAFAEGVLETLIGEAEK